MKKITLGLFFVLFLQSALSEVLTSSVPTLAEYPHWKECFETGTFSNKPKNCSKLQKVDAFIDLYKGQAVAAVFDFDGTLYHEDIHLDEQYGTTLNGKKVQVVAQPAWHRWAANHWDRFPQLQLFPLYRTENNGPLTALINIDNYLEGKVNAKTGKVSGYHKFRQIATLEAGMTPENMAKGVSLYLDKYSPNDYAIYVVLDIMQNMINHQFKVWIVTGSNPYFVSVVLHQIEQLDTTGYFNFGKLSAVPHQPSSRDGKQIKSRIIGNAAKVYDGKFSAVWDDRYLPRDKYDEIYAVMNEGKRLILKDYIEPNETEVVACIGNSGGDYAMMSYVLEKQSETTETLGILINPRGKLASLIDHPNTITLSSGIK
jgi:hypothetical protein